jgi:hypothetical protein
MKFVDVDPAAIQTAIDDVSGDTRQEKMREDYATVARLLHKHIHAQAHKKLLHMRWQSKINGGYTCHGKECGMCYSCYQAAAVEARGREIALESMIERMTDQINEGIILDEALRIAGITQSNRRGKSDMDTRFGGYHD